MTRCEMEDDHMSMHVIEYNAGDEQTEGIAL